MLVEHINNTNIEIKFTEGEQTKINKVLKAAMDLLLLIIELYDSDENKNYIKLNFNNLIKCSVEFILNSGSISEEVILSTCLFMTNLLSLKVFPIEDQNGNNLLNFIEFAQNIVKDKATSSKANVLVVSSFRCSLFYIYCSLFSSGSNSDAVNAEFIQFLINSIYSNINFGVVNQIEELNNSIQNYIKNPSSENNNNNGMTIELDKESNKDNSNLKDKIKITEENIRSTIIYLKTFTDIINSVELKNSNPNDDFMNEEEEIDDEVEIITNENDSENEIEKNISIIVNNLFKNSNYEPLLKMLKFEFLPKLIKFFDNLSIEEFLINDFDKMIVIKELLFDLEYHTLSIINNIIQNYEQVFIDDTKLLSTTAFTIIKRLQIEEYSKNQDFLTVLLTTYRSILEKYKNVGNMIIAEGMNNAEFDFKSLFVILNNNINDSFIKINIVDIISYIYSLPGHSKEVNNEICKLLYNICLNEKDMEVLSHVLNAYFDIYKEDDYESNFILRSNGVVDLMKLGVNEFKIKVQ
jgi:hypothetical protein